MIKTTTRKLLTGALFAAGLLGANISTADDMASNVLNSPCAGCHGTNGASLGEAPIIAGLPAAYLASTMANYKNDSRFSTIMGRLAKGYSDADFHTMGNHFANQPWPNTDHKVDAALAAKGATLHMGNGCSGCHGMTGVSPSPTTPRLAGQFPEYLRIQMEDYRQGSTPIPPAAMVMRSMMGNMSNDDIAALAAFYASQN